MFWKKRCSYKQLFWKLPGEIFSQNPWKISLKKFVFSKVAQSRSRKFYLRKKLAKNMFSQISLLGKNLREVAHCQPVTLLKMNFITGIFQEFWLQISEHLFSRTALKWLLLQRCVQNLVKYLRWSFFVNITNDLKLLTIFTKKLDLRCFTRFCVCLCSEVTSSIYQMYKLKFNSSWRHCNVMLSENIGLLCNCIFATNTKTIIYIK